MQKFSLFYAVLRGDFLFAVRKINVVQVILARANIEEKRYSLQNKNEIEKRKR